ncbi:hypothetical protein CKA32_002318 [Geitlerinema sp. FC II]|nr:hypothetical protein CKA32_002318 [Geitlerinema sp. FC II]
MNTFDMEIAKDLIRRGYEFYGKYPIKVLPIQKLLDIYLPEEVKRKGIGFLNIDCEGLDREIILGLESSFYRPYVIAVESHGFDPLNAIDNEICQSLGRSGYCLAAYTGSTLIFKKL